MRSTAHSKDALHDVDGEAADGEKVARGAVGAPAGSAPRHADDHDQLALAMALTPPEQSSGHPHGGTASSATTAGVPDLRSRLIEFAVHWQFVTQTERASAQSHFSALCDVLGVPKPLQSDPTGAAYAFEKGVLKTGGGNGFADVWRRGHFAWEYKGKKKNLGEAYRQLLNYREDLENPPLLVVCDLDRFEVHTNFTDTKKAVYAFDLADMVRGKATETCPIAPLEVLLALWHDPERLRPGQTRSKVTEAAATEFGRLATSLRSRDVPAHDAARYLIRLLFCLFAEDVDLLPSQVFTKLVKTTKSRPSIFAERLNVLWNTMATGGFYGAEEIRHFNGGMFQVEDVPSIRLTGPDLAVLELLAALDWREVEPAILGTLFERGLDPSKRSQLGAHYTSREDILTIVEPVLMAPFRRRWAALREACQELVAQRSELMRTGPRAGTGAANSMGPTAAETKRALKLENQLKQMLQGFAGELATIRVLDPACGSGNFLYVALRELLDLEKAVIVFATVTCGLTGFFPQVGPEQMAGMETSEYAHDLATVTVQIGFIQWLRDNGFGTVSDPVLTRLELIRNQDALLTLDSISGVMSETPWPEADVIIGNPPFLGDKKMRGELGDVYVDRLRQCYEGRVSGGADLVTYWFERTRALIAAGVVKRAGLLSTNSIRSGENRRVLERIKETGDIFQAWSDRPWVQDGASVRVSVVCFDNGAEQQKQRDGVETNTIHADLSSGPDTTLAKELVENDGLVFLGMMKGGPFDVDASTARRLLKAPRNPDGSRNDAVVRRRLGGQNIADAREEGWIIDFADRDEAAAALFEAPFEYVRRVVKPVRDENRDARMQRLWWLHGRSRPALRAALQELPRCIVTPEVAKHRLFVWMTTDTVPDHTCHVFARADDYFFGVLHSRIHEIWSLAVCNWMGMGNDPRYNSSRTFGTFPMPWPSGKEPKPEEDARVARIGSAARRLVTLRDAWLKPEDVSVVALSAAEAAELSKRTLTGLYNARPTWLTHAHDELDRAVMAAYGWPEADVKGVGGAASVARDQILDRLLVLNKERANENI